MGKKSRKNRRNEGRISGASFADVFNKLVDSGGDSNDVFKEQVEEAISKREETERRRALDDKTRRLLLLPHAYGTGNFADPMRSGFVNPYTFFPLEDVRPERFELDVREHSGKLECELEVQDWSALFIPNTSGVFELPLDDKDPKKKHRSYEFYSYEDLSKVAKGRTDLPHEVPSEPVIPGSSLRGMVRSVYEQLTNSCLPIIDEKSNPIKRTNLPKRAYRMEWDGAVGAWKLYKTHVFKVGAKKDYKAFSVLDAHGRSYKKGYGAYKNLRNMYECQWNPHTKRLRRKVLYCDSAASGWYRNEVFDSSPAAVAVTEFYLHVTGEIGGANNHNHLLMYPCANANAGSELCSIREGDDVFVRFMRVLDTYCEKSTAKNHNDAMACYEAYRAMILGHETVLVYADDGANPTHLAPSSMSPESYGTRIIDLLGPHKPCDGPAFCPACRLFGTVGNNGQLGSRLRFTDGKVVTTEPLEFYEPTSLAPLSTPRTSATEFYLKRPDGITDGVWNYDYVLQGKINKSGEKYLEKHPTPYKDMVGAGIQGRKVYLHSPFDMGGRYTDDAFVKTTQNVTVRPLKRGTFRFELFFQDLTAKELATLVYAIGGMGEGRLQKLGHGKPLGMGSVKVKVTGCKTKTYTYDAEQGIACVNGTLNSEWMASHHPGDERDVARRKLVTFLAREVGENVSYPKPEDGPICNDANSPHKNQTFDWFKCNRGSVLEPKFSNVLKTLSVEEVMHGEAWQDLPC